MINLRMAAVVVFTMLAPAAAVPADANGTARIAVEGDELVIRTTGGTALRGDALTGAVLKIDVEGLGAAEVRIDAFHLDHSSVGGELRLYELSRSDGAGGWLPVCEPNPFGDVSAVLQPGMDGAIAIWCTSGALAKCVHFGYRPWEGDKDGVSATDRHSACVKMMRGDYCGDNRPLTRNGMLINVFDPEGIQERADAPDLPFEAAWDVNGAICVHHPRVPQNASLAQIVEKCPRLRGRVGAICTEDFARSISTPLVLNESRGDGIPELP